MTDHKELTAALDLLDSLLPDGSEGIAVLGAARLELHALTTGIVNTPPGPKPEWQDTVQIQGGAAYAPTFLAGVMLNAPLRQAAQWQPSAAYRYGDRFTFTPTHPTLWQWIVVRLSKKGSK